MSTEVLPQRKKFGSNHRPVEARNNESVSDNDPWLTRAREAFDTSTTFIDTNYRKDWENSILHFQNKHMQGSKYLSESYKYRSKSFRPKTRATGRQLEAATAAAFFSQLDVMSHEPEDDKDPMSIAGSALRQELINYRLSRKGQIPWFQICIGAAQEAYIYGIVSSKQFWDYQDKEVEIPAIMEGQQAMDPMGQPAMMKKKVKIKDQPDIKLYPIENIRFDPAAEWTDLVNSSPYFIAMDPMRIGEVRLKMKSGEWEKVPESTLLSARNNGYDSTRQTRAGDKEDETDAKFSKSLSDFDIVWVHENFMRIDGNETHYYTLGTLARLSKAKPLNEAYLHGIRPFVVGTSVIEPHSAIPDSPVHLSKGLQKDANEINNSRQDNVKLVLNKRFLVKRGRQVDLQSLVRNAAGSITLVNDVQGDVLPLEFQDITSSSFNEQNLINNDLDDLMGSFSQGSVQTNRKLNETVGGMSMLRGSSNAMTQYVIRVFSETWVEKVLNQIDMLEQYYESDMNLLNLMGKRADIQKHGIQAITKDLLMVPSQIVVNVANSAMDPMVRLQAFTNAVKTYAEFRQIMPSDIDPEPVKAYIFGLLGFRDASQFSVDQEGNPQMIAAQQTIQQLQQALETKEMELKSKEEIEIARLEQSEVESERENKVKADIAEMQAMVDLMIAEMGQETDENKIVNIETTKRMAMSLKDKAENMWAGIEKKKPAPKAAA